jgi:hypothetical protein
METQTQTAKINSSLLCRSKVKAYLLDHAKKSRHHKFTRVSAATLDKLEAVIREACRRHVGGHPSSGTTL